VYIIGGIIMALAFVLVLMMKELPLRTKSALDERLEEQANEDAAAALAAQGPDVGAHLHKANDVTPVTAEDDREPVATGAHALVGSGGAHARNDDGPARAYSTVSSGGGQTGSVPPGNGLPGNGRTGNGVAVTHNGTTANLGTTANSGTAAHNGGVARGGEVIQPEPRKRGRHRAEV